MRIIVDTNNYTPFNYSPYLHRGNPTEAPNNPKYVPGQVVVVEHEEKLHMAVVLGCIDEEYDGEARLDLCGMTCLEKIRPAYVDDFGKSNISYPDHLYKECRGFKVTRNWDSNEIKVEEVVEREKTVKQELEMYKAGYNELMCYWDSIHDDEKEGLHKRLEDLGL